MAYEHDNEEWVSALEEAQKKGNELRLIDENTREVVQTVRVPYTGHVEFELHNVAGEKMTVKLYIGHDIAWLGVDGYGSATEADDQGVVVGIDAHHHDAPEGYYEDYNHPSAGHAQAMLWADINKEEPETFSLAKARLENREED